MDLVFLYGPPAVGKLTVARVLSRQTGFPVFHNHLVVDAVDAVFPSGSRPFIELREQLWIQVMERAYIEGNEGLIFTFAPERTVEAGFAARLQARVEAAGGKVLFIELNCPEWEIEQRIENESRKEFGKFQSADRYRQARDSGAFEFEAMPRHGTAIDTFRLSPDEAAREIGARLGRPRGQH